MTEFYLSVNGARPGEAGENLLRTVARTNKDVAIETLRRLFLIEHARARLAEAEAVGLCGKNKKAGV